MAIRKPKTEKKDEKNKDTPRYNSVDRPKMVRRNIIPINHYITNTTYNININNNYTIISNGSSPAP